MLAEDGWWGCESQHFDGWRSEKVQASAAEMHAADLWCHPLRTSWIKESSTFTGLACGGDDDVMMSPVFRRTTVLVRTVYLKVIM